jgi:hypothetical protein
MAFPGSPTEGQTHTENNTVWIYSAVTDQWNRSVINPLNETTYIGSNGAPGGIGGNTQVIFNDNGSLASDAGLVYNKTTDALTTGSLNVTSPGTNAAPSITFTGDLNTGFWNPSADVLAASTAGSERWRVTAAGHFKVTTDGSYTGIDTNTYGVRQTVNGNWTWMNVSSTADPYGVKVSYTGAAPNGASNAFFECTDSAETARFVVKSNGGINNFSSNNTNLSDRNAKKDISLAADTWNCLKDWEIVNYRYKDQPDDADLNLGVIAQQVAESCPEVITIFQEAKEATDDAPAQEERLGVKEQQMYWMTIKAFQEAQVRIEALETEVAALKVLLK